MGPWSVSRLKYFRIFSDFKNPDIRSKKVKLYLYFEMMRYDTAEQHFAETDTENGD
jgi:hypothetical protein